MKFPEWLTVYGDQKFRGKCPTETAEQVTFFNKLRREYPHLAACAVHIRNEGKRNANQVAKEKAEGMLKGAADIFIAGCPAFICELKKQDHTKCHWEGGQQEFLEAAQLNGAFTCVALGYDAAFEALEDWIRDTKHTS